MASGAPCPPVSTSTLSGSQLLTTPSDSSSKSRSFGGKLLPRSLSRGDSGYISSPAVTPASNGTSPQTPFKTLPVQFRVASPPNSTDQREDKMQRQIRLGENSRPLTIEHQHSSPAFPERQALFYSSFQLPMKHEHNLSSHPDSILLAFKCRQSSEIRWITCPHPYCVQTRNYWQHYKTCYSNFYNSCERCLQFKSLMARHVELCTDTACPVVMCNNAKRSNDVSTSENSVPNLNNNKRHHLVRSRSFLSQDNKTISQQAEEIVQRLDNEKPLLSEELPSLSFGRPVSLSAPSVPAQQQQQPDVASFSYQTSKSQGVLSPIAESPVSVGPQSLVPQTFDSMSMSQPPLSIKSHYAYSSYEQDGDNGVPSTMSSILSSQSEVIQEKSVYPEQRILHRLDTTYLTPGEDSFYYKHRDYSVANDVLGHLGQGGFGSCIWARDETTETTFAIKQNNSQNEKNIDSIVTECNVLSRLQYDEHVIRFLGAVFDDYQNSEFNALTPPRTCKMMMELAENGNLKELLVDEYDQPAPLPLDQSLYYLQQILKGVHFLHSNGVLHLDIKGPNVLVFDGGRRVKLADFGTAVHINDISSVGKNLVGCTPYYAPPEVIQQGVPHFSADIWGVLCVFVEMLTAKMPGCYKQEKPYLAMMYLIGHYDDSQIEDLIPLSEMNLDSDLEQIFRDVFRREASQRPTALELLNHPRISSAYEYESCFDEFYEEEGPSQMDLNHPQEQVEITERESLYSNDVVSNLPEFESSKKANNQRPSQDSGIGIADLGDSFDGGCGPMRSSTAPAVLHAGQTVNDALMVGNAQMWKRGVSRQDSAFCDGTVNDCQVAAHCDIPTPQFSFEDFHSLPVISNVPFHDVKVQRSFSMGSTGTPPKSKRRRPSTIVHSQHLTHSNSAPVIRRHSLQLNHTQGAWFDTEIDGVRPCLRRTSSEVYVDKGPDIDSPERVKKMTGDKLTDLEGLLASLRLENAPLQNPRPSLQTTNSKDSELTSSTSASSSASTTSGSSAGSSGKDYDKGSQSGETPPSRPAGNTFDIL